MAGHAPTRQQRLDSGIVRNLHHNGVFLKSGKPVGRKRIWDPSCTTSFRLQINSMFWARACKLANAIGISRARFVRLCIEQVVIELEKTGVEELKKRRGPRKKRIGYKAPCLYSSQKMPWQAELERRIKLGQDPTQAAMELYAMRRLKGNDPPAARVADGP